MAETITERIARLTEELEDTRKAIKRIKGAGQTASMGGASISNAALTELLTLESTLERKLNYYESLKPNERKPKKSFLGAKTRVRNYGN